ALPIWLGLPTLHQRALSAAQAHLAQGIALYGAYQPRAHGVTIGQDPGAACFVHMSLVLWLLGYPEQALQQAHQALSLAERVGHPFSLVFALEQVAAIHFLRGEWRVVQEHAQAISAMATAQGFQLWQAHA